MVIGTTNLLSEGENFWKTENVPEAIVQFTQARDTFSALENQMGYDHMSAVLNKLRTGQSHGHSIPDEGLTYHKSPPPKRSKLWKCGELLGITPFIQYNTDIETLKRKLNCKYHLILLLAINWSFDKINVY